MADLMKIAEALEAAAGYFDAVEAEKTAAAKQELSAKAKDLGAKYAAATGEDLPVDVAEKLASGDEAVLKTVENVISKTAGAVESMGRSSERPDGSPRPTTKEERRKAAYERFGNFLTNS